MRQVACEFLVDFNLKKKKKRKEEKLDNLLLIHLLE